MDIMADMTVLPRSMSYYAHEADFVVILSRKLLVGLY